MKDVDDTYDISPKGVKKTFAEFGLKFPMSVGDVDINMDEIREAIDNWHHVDDDWSVVEEMAGLIGEILAIDKEGADIYRFIFVDNKDDINVDDIGECWTTTEDLGDDIDVMDTITMDRNSVMFSKKYMVKIVAHVPPHCIQTESSILHRLIYPLEREVKIKEGSMKSIVIKTITSEENQYK